MTQGSDNRRVPQVPREERLFTLTVRVEEDLAAVHVLEAMRAAAERAGRDTRDLRFRYEDGLLTLTAKADDLGPNKDLRFRYEDGLLTLTAKADDLAIVRVLNSVRSSVTREDSDGKKDLRFEGEGETLKVTVRVNDFAAMRVLAAVTSTLSGTDHNGIVRGAVHSPVSDDAPAMRDLERGSVPSTIRSFLRERGEAGATRDEINRVVFEATGRSDADTGRSLAALVYTRHVLKVRETTSEGYSVVLYKLATQQ